MMSLFVAIPVGLFILLFAVIALSLALAMLGALTGKLIQDIMLREWERMIGTIFWICGAGTFFTILATGAYTLGAGVIDGFVGRFM